MSKVPKFQFENYPPAKVANLKPVEAPVLANLATLAGGKSENQISHPAVESPKSSEKPASLCPRCQGEIFLRTSFGKIFCCQCLYLMNAEMEIDTAGFTEVDLVLEEAIEKAEERSAIMEHDGGLERKQADDAARALHIQPVVEGLMRSGLIDIEDGSPESQMTVIPLAKVAKVANRQPVELPQANPPAPPVTCAAACPWHTSNPWGPDPALGAWCHRRLEPLATGSPACEEFRRGEVPPRQTHERVPQVQPSTSPAPQEHVLTCFECPLHEHDMVNPTHGWGRCTLKKRGCYGLRPGCSEIQRRAADVSLDG